MFLTGNGLLKDDPKQSNLTKQEELVDSVSNYVQQQEKKPFNSSITIDKQYKYRTDLYSSLPDASQFLMTTEDNNSSTFVYRDKENFDLLPFFNFLQGLSIYRLYIDHQIIIQTTTNGGNQTFDLPVFVSTAFVSDITTAEVGVTYSPASSIQAGVLSFTGGNTQALVEFKGRQVIYENQQISSNAQPLIDALIYEDQNTLYNFVSYNQNGLTGQQKNFLNNNVNFDVCFVVNLTGLMQSPIS